MEGISAENNAIYLDLTAENLSRALKTAQNARALKIKLTNKHFPCLTVSIELVSGGQRRAGPGRVTSGCESGLCSSTREASWLTSRRDVRADTCFPRESGPLVCKWCCAPAAGWDPVFPRARALPTPLPTACSHYRCGHLVHKSCSLSVCTLGGLPHIPSDTFG